MADPMPELRDAIALKIEQTNWGLGARVVIPGAHSRELAEELLPLVGAGIAAARREGAEAMREQAAVVAESHRPHNYARPSDWTDWAKGAVNAIDPAVIAIRAIPTEPKPFVDPEPWSEFSDGTGGRNSYQRGVTRRWLMPRTREQYEVDQKGNNRA